MPEKTDLEVCEKCKEPYPADYMDGRYCCYCKAYLDYMDQAWDETLRDLQHA